MEVLSETCARMNVIMRLVLVGEHLSSLQVDDCLPTIVFCQNKDRSLIALETSQRERIFRSEVLRYPILFVVLEVDAILSNLVI